MLFDLVVGFCYALGMGFPIAFRLDLYFVLLNYVGWLVGLLVGFLMFVCMIWYLFCYFAAWLVGFGAYIVCIDCSFALLVFFSFVLVYVCG